MPYQSAPRPRTIKLVESQGGSIWTTTTDMANGGVAYARSTIEEYHVPDKAKMLLGWRPIGYPCDQAVAESFLAVYDIRGQNFNFQPQEVICGNVAPSILLTGSMLHAPSEYYDVFAPCVGGELWDVGITPCDAIAGNTRVGVEFTWTDKRIPLPVIRSICSRRDALTAATAGNIAGATLQLNFAHTLIEMGGCATESTMTIEEELNVTLIAKCSALKINELRIMCEPVGAAANLANDEGEAETVAARRMQRLPFNQETVTITTIWDVDVAQTVEAQAVSMFRYI
jgi:hypothetical protein